MQHVPFGNGWLALAANAGQLRHVEPHNISAVGVVLRYRNLLWYTSSVY